MLPAAAVVALYWHSPTGEVLAETNLTGSTILWEYVFFGGKRIARRDAATGNVRYYFAEACAPR